MINSILLGVALVAGQVPPNLPPAAPPNPPSNGAAKADSSGDKKSDDKKSDDKKPDDAATADPGHFPKRFFGEYPFLKESFPKWLGKEEKKDENAPEPPPPARRALESPWGSPLPTSEYQGPTIGVPPSSDVFPLMKAIYGGPWGEEIKASRVQAYGWVTSSGNWSNAKNSNTPTSYWIVPNRFELDQAVLTIEREVDTSQIDHMDWGFKFTQFYGMDYRYTTAGGYFSDQLLRHNDLYGYDPLEIFAEVYIPGIADGTVIRVGRYISPPDIEAQLAPQNYLGSHSILFTYDDYTHTGVLATVKLNNYWTVQAAIYAGGDMAPWYPGAIPTGFFGVKWVSHDNNDSVYTCLNAINGAQFRIQPDGTGHDNFNYIVSTWTHKFSKKFITTTEAYYLWQYNALTGGTVSTGPVASYGGGGGPGALIPGLSSAYGAVNYTMYSLTKNDYFTVRNEYWNDVTGSRSGYATSYSSHTIGLSHAFSANFSLRPEIGYYHSYDVPAFDLGTKKNLLMYGFDTTIRF